MTTFTITMRSKPNVDPIKALRGAIKVLGRYYGFRILQIDEIKDDANKAAVNKIRQIDNIKCVSSAAMAKK